MKDFLNNPLAEAGNDGRLMMDKRIVSVFFILLLFLGESLQGAIKSIGLPVIKNFTKQDYSAGTQSWAIAQGRDDKLYFANNNGLLQFDGVNWNTYPLPNSSIVRSLLVGDENRIYVGGFNEFGYFHPDQQGRMSYHSLSSRLPDDEKNFGEIWRIYKFNGQLVFQSYTSLMLWDGKTFRILHPGKDELFHFSFKVNDRLWIDNRAKGLQELVNGQLVTLPGTEKIRGQEIWGILPFPGNRFMIATQNKGVFLYDGKEMHAWNNEADKLLIANRVMGIAQIDGDHYAFGTISHGVVITDSKGNVVQNISREEGLQNNTVLSVFVDNDHNLWLGLDNGISQIKINSPLSLIGFNNGVGATYSAAIYKGKIYLATNQGVVYHSWDPNKKIKRLGRFTMLNATRGQAWSLEVFDNILLVGHNAGAFQIINGKPQQISSVIGYWGFRQVPGHPDLLIGGHYNGLSLFKRGPKGWKYIREIEGFKESSRQFEFDDKGNIWMEHGYRGVFRIEISEDYTHVIRTELYGKKEGLPQAMNVGIYRLKGRLVFLTTDGVYQYFPSTNSFRKSQTYSELFGKLKGLSYIREDKRGNIWYFRNNQAGVMQKQPDGTYRSVEMPFRSLSGRFLPTFEFVLPVDEQDVFIGYDDGVAHYDPTFIKSWNNNFYTLISKVSVIKTDSVIFYGNGLQKQVSSIPYRENDLRFYFAAADMENIGHVTYQLKLEGFDDDWNNWSGRTMRDYTNLPEGDYTFMVRGINRYGVESAPATYRFTILPPWYRSVWAYLVYGFLFLLLVWGIYYFIRWKMKRSKEKEANRQRELYARREEELGRKQLEADKEIIRLRNDKLRNEMVHKEKELANASMEMIQKNKMLNKIKNDLKKATENITDESLQARLRSILRRIDRQVDNEKQWQIFETHFETVHEDFLTRIKEQFPELSPKELKLCAYLRMNISSKEIAALMNISVRGVEISRYRLRKKLGLQRHDNLTDFILRF